MARRRTSSSSSSSFSSTLSSDLPVLAMSLLFLMLVPQGPPTAAAFQMRGSLRSYHQSQLRFPAAKRLMGIFRCNGWGPGCLKVDEDTSRPSFTSKPKPLPLKSYDKMSSSSSSLDSAQQTGPRTLYRTSIPAVSSPYVPRKPATATQATVPRHRSSMPHRHGSGGGAASRNSFEPFFTLTSGGSWGPTGKRSSMKRSSSPVLSAPPPPDVQAKLLSMLLNEYIDMINQRNGNNNMAASMEVADWPESQDIDWSTEKDFDT